MKKINILDCTLRDGGYINRFEFGKTVIVNMIDQLGKANIDIIECGFLKSNEWSEDATLFGSVEAVRPMIQKKYPNSTYVGMIQYGKISGDEISPRQKDSLDGIRVTFHEHEIEGAFVLGEELKKKGYLVFMQPVGTMTYTEEGLCALIDRVNALRPYAFYMVDTLGTMYRKDLEQMFALMDGRLNKDVCIGFHSHNNLQLAFSNAQALMEVCGDREIIIDASVYGMGRGAGNLCTELITQYVNDNLGNRYDISCVLGLIDDYVEPLRKQFVWGYGAAYFIAATSGCHPNYAKFLLDRQTLQIQDIYSILHSIDPDARALFDKALVEDAYLRYMNDFVDDTEAVKKLMGQIGGRSVLLLAPGNTLEREREKILQYMEEKDPYVIGINFLPDLKMDAVFFSNRKRYSSNLEQLDESELSVILTSNLTTDSRQAMIVNYSGYLTCDGRIRDNAGMMCINLLKKAGVREIALAGFDGFSKDKKDYYRGFVGNPAAFERMQQINEAMTERFAQIRQTVELRFVTPSLYEEKKA